jgi:hypothetical protein
MKFYKHEEYLMKKTIFNNAMLAAIVSLTFTSMASAHHMSEDVNPNYDFVDDQISDMHTEVVDTLLEDGELMGGMASNMGAVEPMMGMGGSVDTSDMGSAVTAQVVSVPGSGSGAGSSRR